MAEIPDDVIEKVAGALEGLLASNEIMHDSAQAEIDLTDEGLANLFNVSIDSATQALEALKPYRKDMQT